MENYRLRFLLELQLTVSDNNMVTVKGKLGELKQQVDPEIIVKVENNDLLVQQTNQMNSDHRSMHGLYRSLAVQYGKRC